MLLLTPVVGQTEGLSCLQALWFMWMAPLESGLVSWGASLVSLSATPCFIYRGNNDQAGSWRGLGGPRAIWLLHSSSAVFPALTSSNFIPGQRTQPSPSAWHIILRLPGITACCIPFLYSSKTSQYAIRNQASGYPFGGKRPEYDRGSRVLEMFFFLVLVLVA